MSLIDTLRGLLTALNDSHLPAVIEDRDASGRLVSRRVQLRSAPGCVQYTDATPEPLVIDAIATRVDAHRFDDLASLVAFLRTAESRRDAFLDKTTSGSGASLAVLNLAEPHAGALSMEFPVSPKLSAWTRAARDYSHTDLCDLLLDHRDEIVDPSVVPTLSRLQSSKTVEYDGDGTTGDRAVKVAFKSGAPGSVAIPTAFDVSVPVYTGAWPGGAETRVPLRVGLRVVAPRGEAVTPTFRVSLPDVAATMEAGRAALVDAVRAQLAEVGVRLYLGTPKARVVEVLRESGKAAA